MQGRPKIRPEQRLFMLHLLYVPLETTVSDPDRDPPSDKTHSSASPEFLQHFSPAKKLIPVSDASLIFLSSAILFLFALFSCSREGKCLADI
jgi:hypothetical protein